MTTEEMPQGTRGLSMPPGLQAEGAQVVGQGPVGVAGRGRVLEPGRLVGTGLAALDGGLGHRLEGDRPLGQGEQGVTAGRVGPGPLGHRRGSHRAGLRPPR